MIENATKRHCRMTDNNNMFLYTSTCVMYKLKIFMYAGIRIVNFLQE